MALGDRGSFCHMLSFVLNTDGWNANLYGTKGVYYHMNLEFGGN